MWIYPAMAVMKLHRGIATAVCNAMTWIYVKLVFLVRVIKKPPPLKPYDQWQNSVFYIIHKIK